MSEFSERVECWKAKGHEETFEGHSIHCHFHPGDAASPQLLLILHGYPTCSFDWATSLPLLPKSTPFLIFDMLGYGLSAKPSAHSYSLLFQADLAVHLALLHNKATPQRKIFLVGHDMGTSVAAELLARDLEGSLPPEFQLNGTLLFNGNMAMDKSSLIWGQRLLRSPLGPLAARLTFSWIFRRSLGSVFSAGHPLTAEEGEDQWTLLRSNGGHAINHKLIEYTRERVQRKERWLGAVREWRRRPLTFLWGMEDPVATAQLQLAAWKELRPDVEVVELEGLGHYPQIEDPRRFAQVLAEIMNKHEN